MDAVDVTDGMNTRTPVQRGVKGLLEASSEEECVEFQSFPV